MDNIFQDFTAESELFKDKEVLHPTYDSTYLPHRTKQIKTLAAALSPALKGGKPSNVFIHGGQGIGKTATVKYVCMELEAMCKKIGRKCTIVYINGEIFDTQYRVFAYLARVFNKRVPMIGWPTDMVYSEFKAAIDTEERCVIVIVDDADKLANKGDEALYILSRVNSELTNAKLSVVCISGDSTFMELQEPEVRSALCEKEILFLPYDTYQLIDILEDRAKKAFNASQLGDAVIPLCAEFAVQEQGDVRYALDLLRVAAEIADRTKSKKLTQEHVRLAKEQIEEHWIAEVVNTLPLQSKILLNAIIILIKATAKRYLFSGEVYATYQKICAELSIEALTQRRVTDLISELDSLGLLTAKVINRGRYGRTKEISLIVPVESIQLALTGETTLEPAASIKVESESGIVWG